MPIATPLADEMQFHFHSMTELIETRAREIPDKQVVSVPDKSFNYTSYTYKQINDGADKLAWYYSRREGLVSRNKGDTVTRLNTTLLAPSAVDYAIHELALAKMGTFVRSSTSL
jgi:acyl-CoA synthetase (AMP-forming)/AMP-acid ligase II